jgi:hypothetical protein
VNRKEIIAELSNYFETYEWVDRTTWNVYGDEAWQFFDTDLLHSMLIIRKGIGKPITANDWKTSTADIVYDERGLRTNLCDIVEDKTELGKLYLSGHVLGKALDFKVKGMDSEDVRIWIKANGHLFPTKIRLEHIVNSTGKVITWVHIDTKYLERNPQVYLFNI